MNKPVKKPAAKSSAIENTLKKIASDFAIFESTKDKMHYLVDLGKGTNKWLDEHIATDANIIHGCATHAWIWAEQKGEKIWFKAFCHEPVMRGMFAIMAEVMSNQSIGEIEKAKIDWNAWIDAIGLKGPEALDQIALNGLAAAAEQMKQSAVKFADSSPALLT